MPGRRNKNRQKALRLDHTLTVEQIENMAVYKAGKNFDYVVSGTLALPNSQARCCSRCTTVVNISVTSQERLKLNPKAKLICVDCYNLMPEDEDTELMRPSESDMKRDLLGLGNGNGPRYG